MGEVFLIQVSWTRRAPHPGPLPQGRGRIKRTPCLNASCKASGFLLRLTCRVNGPTSAASVAKWPKAPVCGTGDHGFEPRRSPQPAPPDAPVAQWIERWASDPEAAGSTPARRANTLHLVSPSLYTPSGLGLCGHLILCSARVDSRESGNDGKGAGITIGAGNETAPGRAEGRL